MLAREHLLEQATNLTTFCLTDLLNSPYRSRNPWLLPSKTQEAIKWSKSHSVVSNSLQPHGLYSPWHSLSQNAGVSSLSLLQGIFPTHRSNPGLPHCRWILYQLSYQGSARILEWVAYPFSSESSWPRNRTGCPALQADSLPVELSEKPRLREEQQKVV